MTTTTLERPATTTANPETGLEAGGQPPPAETGGEQVRRVVGQMMADKGIATPKAEEAAAEGNFDLPVMAAQRSWLAGRDAKYRALFEAAPLVRLALEFPKAWDAYRKDKGVKGRTIEAQSFELVIETDPEANEISSTRRAIYGNVIGYFAFECEDMTADEAIEALKGEGGMEQAAERYRFLHPALFTTKEGRKSRATGKRPGRPPGSGKGKKATAEPLAVAGMQGLDENGQITGLNNDPPAFMVAFSRGLNGERMKLPPFTSHEEADRIFRAIQAKPLSEVDAFLAGEGLTPEPAEDQPEFHAASDAARELPPTMKLGEEAEGEGKEAEGTAKEKCVDEIVAFLKIATNEELVMVRDYCRSLRVIVIDPKAEAAD